MELKVNHHHQFDKLDEAYARRLTKILDLLDKITGKANEDDTVKRGQHSRKSAMTESKPAKKK